MKRSRTAWIVATLLVSVGGIAFIGHQVEFYPASDEFLPTLHSVVSDQGYRIAMQKQRGWPSTPAPFVLRPQSIWKPRATKNRLGVGSPYWYCDVSEYESDNDGLIELHADIIGGQYIA